MNQAIYLITTGAREASFRNIKTIAECLADELINAAKGSSNRCAAGYSFQYYLQLWPGQLLGPSQLQGPGAACSSMLLQVLVACPAQPCTDCAWSAAATRSRRRTRLSAWPRPTAEECFSCCL